MQEAGIDISNQTSNTTDELIGIKMDYVFTVCSDAHETCPVFPGGKIVHVGFDDPPRLTVNEPDHDKKLDTYRRVRDEIKTTVANIERHMEN